MIAPRRTTGGGGGTRGRGQLVWHVSPIEFCIYHEAGGKEKQKVATKAELVPAYLVE